MKSNKIGFDNFNKIYFKSCFHGTSAFWDEGVQNV